MKIHTLGRKTDLVFGRFSGSVLDRGSYTVIQTPKIPGYHWGNYIIFDRAPRKGDLNLWTEIFKKEFSYYPKLQHLAFTWETPQPEPGDVSEFVGAGFYFDAAAVLTARKAVPPRKFNSRIEVRRIETDEEWSRILENQVSYGGAKYVNHYFREFKRQQVQEYRRMSESGLGAWYGAFLGSELVADLGIYNADGMGRFRSVGTRPEYRRQGICGSLVYLASEVALRDLGVDTLVIEADPEYHAISIYESVGFKRQEINFALGWWENT